MVFEENIIEKIRCLHRDSEHETVIDQLKDEPLDDQPELQLIFGLALFMSSDQQRGLKVIRCALKFKSDNVAWRSDAALAKIVTGDIATAATWLEEITIGDSATAVDFGRLASARLALGEEEEAVVAFQEAIDREPGRVHWHHNLGSVYMKQGKLEQALEQYSAAIAIAPEFERSVVSRRALLSALDKTEELVAELETLLAEDEEDVGHRIQLARALEQDNRLSDAIRSLAHATRPVKELLSERGENEGEVEGSDGKQSDLATGLPEGDSSVVDSELAEQISLRVVQAELFSNNSRHAQALKKLEEIAELQEEEDPAVVAGRCDALTEMGRYEEAEALLEEAEEAFPDNNQLNIVRSHLLTEKGDYEAAEELLRALVEIYPGNASLLSNLGQTLLWVGKLDEAAEYFERAGEINPLALAQIVRTRRMPSNPAALEKMESIAENRLLQKGARSTMNFALADLYDREKEYQKAARFMTTANELANSELSYSPSQFSKKVDSVIRVFSSEYFENLPEIRGSDRVPVFVVGMPRSGTTLSEQILSSHPDVFGAGELELLPVLTRLMPRVLKTGRLFPGCMKGMTAELREEAARYFLYGIQQHDEEASFVVDKMPHNFVNLGLIASILPKAKIVHIFRDPRDNALSNYLQNFKARDGGMGYAFHLGNIARQINDYTRMMAHWREVLPMPIFELSYEELVEDQEGITRELLQFIGVEWSDDVKDFHKNERAVRTASVSQVRQPIYKSSKQKWRNYEEVLQPLITGLDEEVLKPWL